MRVKEGRESEKKKCWVIKREEGKCGVKESGGEYGGRVGGMKEWDDVQRDRKRFRKKDGEENTMKKKKRISR